MVTIQNSEHNKMKNKEVARLTAENAALVHFARNYLSVSAGCLCHDGSSQMCLHCEARSTLEGSDE